MEKNINQKLLATDPSASMLIKLLSDQERELGLEDAYLSHNFPFYTDIEDVTVSANVLLISKNHGLVIFQCGNYSSRNFDQQQIIDEKDHLEHVYSLIFSKLIKSKFLRSGINELRIKISASIFLSDLKITDEYQRLAGDFLIISDLLDLKEWLKARRRQSPFDDLSKKEILAILEGSKGIIKPKTRKIENDQDKSKGALLNQIESQIANFDNEQRSAALFIGDGFQRIRGLAGSGKTIVLAMKAAQIHLQDPQARILYTFHTKSLYPFIKRLITRFYRQFAERDPDWEKINILHAWGGRNLGGVYYNACLANNIKPTPLSEAQSITNGDNPFNKICQLLCQHELQIMYDYTILDEAQDFPIHFYRLCRAITCNNCVIWGYDECQNIFNIEIQDDKETFGKDGKGVYYCDFSRAANYPQDIILHNCYRNPNRILICAFALGFGIYSERIVQMLENNEHWADLGFDVLQGNSKEGDKMQISRSPGLNLEQKEKLLESVGPLFEMKACDSFEQEIDFVVHKIEDDIKQKLLPEDILVVCLDDLNARSYFKVLSDRLYEKGIKFFNLLEAPSITTDFVVDGHVTLTTVYRAKGNEAGSVYIMGVDSVFNIKNSINERNKIFTAITRAKVWATVTGVGTNAKECEKEVKKVFENYPHLTFTMPNRTQLKNLQRDLEVHQKEINEIRKKIDEVAAKAGLDKKQLMDNLFKENRKKGGFKE